MEQVNAPGTPAQSVPQTPQKSVTSPEAPQLRLFEDSSTSMRLQTIEGLLHGHIKEGKLNVASSDAVELLREQCRALDLRVTGFIQGQANTELKQELEKLRQENNALKGRITQFEAPGAAAPAAAPPAAAPKPTGYSTCCKVSSIFVTLLVGLAGVALYQAPLLMAEYNKYMKV